MTPASFFIKKRERRYVKDGKLIYGKETRNANRSIEFVSETLSTTPAGKKFVESGDSLGVMTKSGSGHTGKTARLWKVVYENGQEVSRGIFNNSTYSASPVTVNVGTASDNAEASALVKAAIATQDEGQINNAINLKIKFRLFIVSFKKFIYSL